MLFKLSLNNIRKGVKDYAIYFVTLVLGIAIFYIFNAIETQASFLILSESAREAIQLMMSIITGMSVFIAIVLGLLIVYASRFLMKRRNREFALYMMLGMRKGTIAGILTVENLVVGALSLVVGLAAGVFLSQLMSMLVAQLFEADMTQFSFTFSSDAFFKTILYFGIIMVAVLVFNLIMVGKARLISLLQSGSRAEKVKMKNPVLCVIFFLLGAACLVYSYWKVTGGVEQLGSVYEILIPIFIGIIGTFFVFWSVSGLILTILSHLRGTYYKGLNSFTFRQFSSRINTMVVSLTVICVMLFFTISIISAAFSLRTSLNQTFSELTPVDVDVKKFMTGADPEEVFGEGVSEEEAQQKLSLTMKEALSQAGCDPDQMFSEYEQVTIYGTEDFTFEEAFGQYLDQMREDYPNLYLGAWQDMMTVSDYNKVAKLFHQEPIELENDEYVIVCNSDISKTSWDRVLSGGVNISVFGHDMKPKYPETRYGFASISSMNEETGLYIVPDDVVDPEHQYYSKIVGNYRASDKKEIEVLEHKLLTAVDGMNQGIEGYFSAFVYANTKLDIRSSTVSLTAVVTFLGLYLGFVFLISGAAILALKSISDSIDSKGRYQMLRQIGAEEKDITGSLRKQQALLFLLPLLLALVHSIFGLRFTEIMFQSVGAKHTTESMLLTGGIILIIYLGYFFVTFLSSRKIIRES